MKVEEYLKALSEDKLTSRAKPVSVSLNMCEHSVVELALQKEVLVQLSFAITGCFGNKEQSKMIEDALTGVVHLIDGIQDEFLDHQDFDERNILPFMVKDDEEESLCESPDLDIIHYREALKTLLVAAHKDLPKYLSLSPMLDRVLRDYFSKGDI